MAFVPSKLQETFRIQCPGAEMNDELKDVYFEMRPLTRHEVSSIYEKRVKNNKGISKFLEEQWLKSCISWENVVDDRGSAIPCSDETKREWFRNPALQPLIEELLSELENRSREQLGIQEKN
jgi:hypothetical protein|tara:strand:+ start:297 stop:662 length:366 start_codon:yes stop_codon:yes gene_type:complete